MATFTEATIEQGTYEIRKWTADFSADIPTGGSVTAGTAYHVPPYGSASTPTIAYDSTTVSATLSNLSVLGQHYVDIVATYNNGEKSQVRVTFSVVHDTTAARQTMASLIRQLRGNTEAGAGDYKIAGVSYWSDSQLQEVLEENYTDYKFEPMTSYPVNITGGSLSYKEYRTGVKHLESTSGGTSVFYIQDSTGATIGTAAYTPNYNTGVIEFVSDTAGSSLFFTGKSYDLNAAAADIWRRKAAHYAPTSFDFSTDNHSIHRSQVYQHCKEMADYFSGNSGSSMTTVTMYRSDMW